MKTQLLFTISLIFTICIGVHGQTLDMHYDFNDNLNDSSGNGYSLAEQGGFTATYEADQANTPSSALTFSGAAAHYLESSYTGVSGTNARTITAWIKTTSNLNQTIVSWGSDAGGNLFEVMTKSGELRVKIGNAASTTAYIKKTVSNLVNGGDWHHIAVTVPANGTLTDCILYVDGGVATIANTASGATSINTTLTTGVRIGNSIVSSNYFRNGAIDDVRIYSSELNASEVLAVSGISVTAPAANFTGPNTANIGEIITFSDTSTESPSSWDWDFGDALAVGDRTAQNPSVSFQSAGTYSITLTSTNSGGSDVITKTDYIIVSPNSGNGDLQAQYNFNGDIMDASPFSRNLIAQDALTPTYTTRLSAGDAYSASNNYAKHLITGYPGIGGGNARTITAWFNSPNTASGRDPIVSWGANTSGQMFNVMLDGGVPRIEGGASSLQTSDTGLNDGNWHHIAVTFDPNDGDKLANCKIYIDGNLSTNLDDSGASFASETTVLNTNITTNFLKVTSAVYSTYRFEGAIDDLRIYSKALSAGQITTVMGGGTLTSNNVSFKDNELNVFPNAVSDILNIQTSVSKRLNIKIYSMLGELVKTASSKKVDMSHLSAGLYVITIKAGTKVANLKIVKK